MAEYPSQFKVLPRVNPARDGKGKSQLVMRRAGARMEKCLFGNEEVLIPEALVEDTFLPSFPENDVLEKQETLRHLFGGQNFKFGNPLRKFHKTLRDGLFSPDIAKYAALCRKAKLREYRYQQQVYYATLLKEVLVNRQRILEQMYLHRPDSPITYNHFTWKPQTSASSDRSLHLSVQSKVKSLLREVSEECGVEHVSSDDDDFDDLSPHSYSHPMLPPGITETDSPDSPPQPSSVFATLDPARPMVNGQPALDVPIHRRHHPREITEQDYQQMLARHKKRRREYPDHPELDTRKVVFEDILAKCHIKAKSLKAHMLGPPKKKAKMRNEDVKKEVGVVKTEGVSVGGVIKQETSIDEPDSLSYDVSLTRNESSVSNNFLSLLRDFIEQEPEGKISTVKITMLVQQWQDTPQAVLNSWFTSNTWSDLVPSALKFLTTADLVTCEESSEGQMWAWSGRGLDSDTQLASLYQAWLDKLSSAGETEGERSGSPPPPRSKTTYTVRPSTEEEKLRYQKQERERYSNPSRAFTVKLHGYEAVLGPVKGVYGKESSAMTKAREHNLLINDRPPFVTILTLVRDAAARLPNGEGTRGDICELLKDSQFLAPNVTDTQINTVVSGALDRLHYEKDPCVKYDVNRKLWIYLHRSRTEEEFEKIHEAQGAAVKAKKALGKPKPKKSKEAVPAAAATPPTVTRQSSALSTGSNDSFINVETLSPTSSPRPGPVSPRGTSPRLLLSTPSTQTKPSLVSSTAKVSQILQAANAESNRPAIQPPASARILASQQSLASGKLSIPTVTTVQTDTISASATSILASKLASPVASPGSAPSTPTLNNPVRLISSPRAPSNPARMPRLVQQLGGNLQQLGGTVTVQQIGTAGQPIIGTLQPGVTQQLVTSSVQGQQAASIRAASAQLLRTSGGAGTVAAALQRTRAAETVTDATQPALTQAVLTKVPSTEHTSTPVLQAARASPQTNFATKPIIIGGKPLQIGGKPVQIVGKPGSSAQFGVVQGLQGQVQGIQGQVQGLQGQAQVVSTLVSQASLTSSSVATSSTPATASSSPAAAAYVSAQLAQVLQNAGQGQLKVTGSLGNVSTAKLLSQKAGGSQGKALTMSQTNLLAGQQILVQQAGQTTAKVVTPQQLLTTGLRPAVISGGKPGSAQNIQLVKTVLAQPGGKPGQTTILLSQPGTPAHQALTTLGASAVHSTPVSKVAASTSAPTPAKSKAGPVYARIITPPPGMRLAAVRGSTAVVSSAGLSSVPPGVIQALSRLPSIDTSQIAGQVTPASDTNSSSDSELK